jgi:hypothetical protein
LQTFEESKTFATPLTASSLRILVKKPSNVEDLYEFSLDIFACYEDVIAETGECNHYFSISGTFFSLHLCDIILQSC